MDIGKPERGKYLSSLLKCSWSQLASSLIPASTRAEGVGPGMPCLFRQDAEISDVLLFCLELATTTNQDEMVGTI